MITKNKSIIIVITLLSILFSKEYIAIFDFDYTGVTKNESKVLTQSLTSKMINLNKYIVLERSNIDKILKEQKFQHSGCTDSECAVQIGQLLNVDYTIIGSIGKLGSTYTIDSRIIEIESGQAIRSAQYIHRGEIDALLDEGMNEIAYKLSDIKLKSNKQGTVFKNGIKINIPTEYPY